MLDARAQCDQMSYGNERKSSCVLYCALICDINRTAKCSKNLDCKYGAHMGKKLATGERQSDGDDDTTISLPFECIYADQFTSLSTRVLDVGHVNAGRCGVHTSPSHSLTFMLSASLSHTNIRFLYLSILLCLQPSTNVH